MTGSPNRSSPAGLGPAGPVPAGLGLAGPGLAGPGLAGPGPAGLIPVLRRPSRRDRTRPASSAAAFLVNVRPSTRSGLTRSFATSHTSLAAMVSLLPDPAPAITAIGDSGALITAA